MKNTLLFLFISFLLVSCGLFRKKQNASLNPAKKAATKKELIDNLIANEKPFETLELKLATEIKHPIQQKAKTILRIKRGEQIWMSIQAFGLEVARGLFDQNEIQFLDKFNKVYYHSTYIEIAQNKGIKLSYSDLENLFLGRMIKTADTSFNISLEPVIKLMKSFQEGYKLEYVVEQNTLTKQYIYSQKKTMDINLYYSKQLLEKMVPLKWSLTLRNGDKLIGANFETISINKNTELKMPFKVTSKYDKVKL